MPTLIFVSKKLTTIYSAVPAYIYNDPEVFIPTCSIVAAEILLEFFRSLFAEQTVA